MENRKDSPGTNRQPLIIPRPTHVHLQGHCEREGVGLPRCRWIPTVRPAAPQERGVNRRIRRGDEQRHRGSIQRIGSGGRLEAQLVCRRPLEDQSTRALVAWRSVQRPNRLEQLPPLRIGKPCTQRHIEGNASENSGGKCWQNSTMGSARHKKYFQSYVFEPNPKFRKISPPGVMCEPDLPMPSLAPCSHCAS